MAGFWENDALVDAPAPKGKAFWESDALADGPAPVATAASAASEADRAMSALKPFFDKGVSTRNSAGQWTGEARALLTKQGVNPDAIDQKAERGILSAYESQQSNDAQGAAAVGRGIINGVPVIGPALLGGTNKAVAFVRSIQNRTPYSDELKNVEGFGERIAKENPGATIGGELAGGVLGTAPLVAAAPAAFGAGAGSLAARSGASLLSGAGLGGADAAVRSGGDIGEAGRGAALGGALGGAAPAAGALVGKGVRAAADVLAARRVSVPGASNPAAAMLAEDLKNSGGAAPVRARLDELGPEAMLLDASPSFQGLAQGLAVEPNTRQAMVAPLRSRNLSTNARLGDDLTTALGTAENPVALTETLTDARRAVAEPAFKRYEATPFARSPDLDALAKRPIIAEALRQAEKVAGNQGKPLARVTMDEAGRVVPDNAAEAFAAGSRGRIDQGLGNLLGRKGALATADEIIARRAEEAGPLYESARAAVIPDEAIPVDLLRRLKKAGALSQAQQKMAIDGQPFDIGRVTSWDYMKRALDDRIGAAKRKGSNDDARIFTGLKNELTSSIDEAIPEYAQARQAFAGHSELVDALEEGSRVFSPSTTREAVAQAYKGLTPGEQEMYRLGAGNALREKLANTRDGNGLPHAVFGSQALREKLAVIAPDGDAAKAFGNLIAGEQRAFTEATVPDATAWRNAYEIVAARAAKLGDTAEGRAAAQAAADLRARLEANPDFKSAATKTDEYDRLLGAVDKGTKVLAGDRSTIHPRELEAYLSGASPAEQAALRAGTRGELDRIVGTQANDLVALRRQVLSDGDWNRAKLAQIFGEDEANRVFQSVDRESAFRDAYNKIVENSQTAQRTQSAERVAVRGTAPNQGDAGLAIAGGVGGPGGVAAALGMKSAKFGLNARGRASDLARNKETAAILTMKAGPERDALIAALEDRLAAVGRGEAPANAMDRFVRQALQSINDRSERPALAPR